MTAQNQANKLWQDVTCCVTGKWQTSILCFEQNARSKMQEKFKYPLKILRHPSVSDCFLGQLVSAETILVQIGIFNPTFGVLGWQMIFFLLFCVFKITLVPCLSTCYQRALTLVLRYQHTCPKFPFHLSPPQWTASTNQSRLDTSDLHCLFYFNLFKKYITFLIV